MVSVLGSCRYLLQTAGLVLHHEADRDISALDALELRGCEGRR